MSVSTDDARPEYWDQYSNHQKVKHDLIRNYLNGWFPKLGLRAGKILYVDTHSGRGRYGGGESGSPIVALTTFLEHDARDKILQKSDIQFLFFEADEGNYQMLKQAVKGVGQLPPRVHVDVEHADCFVILDGLLSELEEQGSRMASAFVFVDPYGFSLPGSLLKRLMRQPRVELFVNVIWRELDMAMVLARNQPGMRERINALFNGADWQNAICAESAEDRVDETAQLFAHLTGAKWATYIRMLGKNGVTRYFLLHLTNHDAGRDLMKECIWSACPEGGYHAKKVGDAGQLMLIIPEPDLMPLRDWVMEKLKEAPKRWQALIDELLFELWRTPQLNQVIRDLRKEGKIEPTLFEGRFGSKANPLLSLK